MRHLVLIACLAGCTRTAYIGDASAPLELDGALAYLDDVSGDVIIVDPDGAAGPSADRHLHRVAVAENPSAARSLPHPGSTSRQLVVLDPGAEQVVILRDKHGHVEAIDVGLPFDAFDVSADGRFALAYQPEDLGAQHSLFVFPNAVAVVDLGEAPKATSLRLPSASARPRKAAFAESMVLGGGVEARLALVFVEGGVVPVDVERAVAGAMIPLGSLHDVVVPEEVVFTDNRGDAQRGTLDNLERVFVRGDNGELYVLSVTAHPSGPLAPPLVALENIVTPDAFVHDIELFFDSDGRELLLAAAGAELILVDGYTGVASRFAQDTYVDTLRRFVDPTSGVDLALAYGRGHDDGVVLRLDPLALDQRRASGLLTMRFADRVSDIAIAAGAGRAVLRYDDERTIGVLDLVQSGQVLDIQMADGAQAAALSPDGSRMFVVGDSPADDDAHLAEVRLAPTLATDDVRLDAPGAYVGVVGGHIYVDHGAAGGSVTFFPDGDLSRGAARTFAGVLFTKIFDSEVRP